MRKFICIIALLCSIFVSEAQLILPVGKSFNSLDVTIKQLDASTGRFETANEFPLAQKFTFISKDSITVEFEGEIIVTIKIKGKAILEKTFEHLDFTYFNISRSFEGTPADFLMAVITDKTGKVLGLAIGTETKVSYFLFDKLKSINT